MAAMLQMQLLICLKGEHQKIVDFALLQAIQTMGVDPDQGVLVIYDIACQYSVHLKERIGHHLLASLTIDHAISQFHVHGHKDQCFFWYSTAWCWHHCW